MKNNIVFTDSGLGGLSIMTDFVQQLQSKKIPGEFDITFFNALPCDGIGYNKRDDVDEKINIFNRALFSIKEQYNPDIIAIACNTLSALYPQTDFSQKVKNNVIEIIEIGRQILKSYRKKDKIRPVYILATPTTVRTEAYKNIISKSYNVAAGNLASEIELDINSEDVIVTVENVFKDIKSQNMHVKDIVLFLGCTHYNYIINLWIKTALQYDYNVIDVLDPAGSFNDQLLHLINSRGERQNINLSVESCAKIDPQEMENIAKLIRPKSDQIADLLQNYKRIKKNF